MISHPLPKRAATAALLLSTGLLATACGVKSQVTVTARPSAPAATPTAAQPTSARTTPSSSAKAPACPTRYLSAKIGPSGAAAGSVYTNIDLTNISNVTCTLYGYPGVVLAGGTPVSPIGQSAAENPGTPRQLVTLVPGAVASALLRIVQAADFPSARCHPAKTTYLQIIPPNQRTPIFLSYPATACAARINILTIDATKPGPGSA